MAVKTSTPRSSKSEFEMTDLGRLRSRSALALIQEFSAMTSIAIQRSVKTGFRLAVAAAVVAICGCAAGSGTLSGKVTFKGKTVASGNVLVVGADGIARSSKIETDGSYTVPDVPVGEAKISVNSPNPVPDPVVVAAAN